MKGLLAIPLALHISAASAQPCELIVIYCKPIAAKAINAMRDGRSKDHVISTGLYNHACVASPASVKRADIKPVWAAPARIYWTQYAPRGVE
ncbi:hypothetical protein D1O30_06960 [Methylocystis hirsuta]|uniref:Uncharacterized protein n=1 Tax=Methylocystis hirsuta TaxID=369798 RepID=A0A3M9XQJ4_9HYPH|nr:hypothetical protein D1O30_06960 [Methylocystis hirsuta]